MEMSPDVEELKEQMRQLRELVLSESRRRRGADALLRDLLADRREVLSPALPLAEEDGARSFRGTKGTAFHLELVADGVSRIELRSGEQIEVPSSDVEEWFVAEIKEALFGPILSLPPREFLARLTRAVHGMLSIGDEE